MTLYLRAETRAAMDAALAAAGIPIEGCEWCAVDHIGPVYGPAEGEPGAETFPLVDGRHHANLLFHHCEPTLEQLALLPVIEPPANPVRIFA
jgi:hypothetical protein